MNFLFLIRSLYSSTIAT